MDRYKVVETQKATGLGHKSTQSEPVFIEAKSMRSATTKARKLAKYHFEGEKWQTFGTVATLDSHNHRLDVELVTETFEEEIRYESKEKGVYRIHGLGKEVSKGLQLTIAKYGDGWTIFEETTGKKIMPPSWRGSHSNKTRDGAIAILCESIKGYTDRQWNQIQEQIGYSLVNIANPKVEEEEVKVEQLTKAETLNHASAILESDESIVTVVVQKSGRIVAERFEVEPEDRYSDNPEEFEGYLANALGTNLKIYLNHRNPIRSQWNSELNTEGNQIIREVRFELADWKAYREAITNQTEDNTSDQPVSPEEAATMTDITKAEAMSTLSTNLTDSIHPIKDGIAPVPMFSTVLYSESTSKFTVERHEVVETGEEEIVGLIKSIVGESTDITVHENKYKDSVRAIKFSLMDWKAYRDAITSEQVNQDQPASPSDVSEQNKIDQIEKFVTDNEDQLPSEFIELVNGLDKSNPEDVSDCFNEMELIREEAPNQSPSDTSDQVNQEPKEEDTTDQNDESDLSEQIENTNNQDSEQIKSEDLDQVNPEDKSEQSDLDAPAILSEVAQTFDAKTRSQKSRQRFHILSDKSKKVALIMYSAKSDQWRLVLYKKGKQDSDHTDISEFGSILTAHCKATFGNVPEAKSQAELKAFSD